MKKRVILFACMASMLTMQVHAQYFQHIYGSQPKNEFLSDGHNTGIGGINGHLLIGPSPFLSSFGSEFAITIQRTDINGSTVGPMCFNNLYTITDITGPAPAMNPTLVMREAHSVELNDQSGYAIAGGFVGGAGPNLGVFFGIIDPNGNPSPLPTPPISNAMNFYPGPGYIDVHVSTIFESKKNPGNLYICGYLTDAATRLNKVFALKVDQSGNLIWNRIYDLGGLSSSESAIPHAMIESPYLDPVYQQDQFIIVGEYIDNAGAANTKKGFILKIEDVYGNMYNPVKLYGSVSTDSWFTSITATSNPNISAVGEGFLVAGNTKEAGANYDMWSMAIDNNDNLIWSKRYNYVDLVNVGGPTLNNDFCNDVIERINTNSLSEYYLAGYTDFGVQGFDDMVVMKIDDWGNSVAGGQFTYGDIDADRAIRIDQMNGIDPNSDGLSIFGYGFMLPPNTIGGFDHYLVKSYFNGVTPCLHDEQNADQHNGPLFYADENGDNYSQFSYQYMIITIHDQLTELEVCHTPSDPNGNNARGHKPQKNEEVWAPKMSETPLQHTSDASLAPNPVKENPHSVGLQYRSSTNTQVRVELRDALGRSLRVFSFDVTEGENLLELNMTDLRLSQAIYYVSIHNAETTETLRLSVTK